MKRHGNSNQNNADHHLYEIYDQERKDTYKYGICGDPLHPDGSSPRATRQVNFLNGAVGWVRFLANILLIDIPGRMEAKRIESEHIAAYREKHASKPRGNL